MALLQQLSDIGHCVTTVKISTYKDDKGTEQLMRVCRGFKQATGLCRSLLEFFQTTACMQLQLQLS